MRAAECVLERQNALHVEFVDCFGVVRDLGERQFFAQLVALAAVAGEVDRFGVEERFVEPVELLLDRLDPPAYPDLGQNPRMEQRWLTVV